ncbi:hypothetical protein PRIPAC_93417 [Pristionchus pacificus]|uniref:Uncharacterized protein n=1 Tax=Pristionchus pacificus TaxID=54126 RepID=A0A2A6BIU0_PRIPA|nr:hypothetical protein PRIPAC_93417 [Pristionchus pacificus]|eukprot:PDM65711.1 hypothetical protein PRIPAC_45625 [Pristionchus pacificus]
MGGRPTKPEPLLTLAELPQEIVSRIISIDRRVKGRDLRLISPSWNTVVGESRKGPAERLRIMPWGCPGTNKLDVTLFVRKPNYQFFAKIDPHYPRYQLKETNAIDFDTFCMDSQNSELVLSRILQCTNHIKKMELTNVVQKSLRFVRKNMESVKIDELYVTKYQSDPEIQELLAEFIQCHSVEILTLNAGPIAESELFTFLRAISPTVKSAQISSVNVDLLTVGQNRLWELDTMLRQIASSANLETMRIVDRERNTLQIRKDSIASLIPHASMVHHRETAVRKRVA